jgi:NifU-like protein involved in Fe-S cluster formation
VIDDVYNRRILELAGNIPRMPRLADAHGSATAHSRLCGSTVSVDIKIADDVVTDYAHDVKACALGQASSAIMAAHVVGARVDELRRLKRDMTAMLKEDADPPGGRWADLAVLTPVRDYKARHASTLLVFDAVVQAIEQAEAQVGA